MASLLKTLAAVLPKQALASGYKCGAAIPRRGAFSTLTSSPSLGEEQHHEQPCSEKQAPQRQLPTKNIRLEAIKSAGITQLHNQTQDIIARTRQPLFEETPVDDQGRKRQSIAQIQEGNRLEAALVDAFAHHSSKHDTFNVGGQCVEILGVEVSPDLKQARAYWCLPRSLDLNAIPVDKLTQLVKRMQKILDERGGRIQGLVHTRLRAYYPPKITFVAAEHVSRDLKRVVSVDDRKRKWR